MRAALSPAGAQLLRALLTRIGLPREQVLVAAFCSVDWQSLTFIGERHEISLCILGPDAASALSLLREGLSDVEWTMRGHVVADIAILDERDGSDGALLVDLEALTLSD